ncbi:glycosyltransferase family 8 protein [Neisseria gonorrhoeae]
MPPIFALRQKAWKRPIPIRKSGSTSSMPVSVRKTGRRLPPICGGGGGNIRFIDVSLEDFAGFPLNIRHISITTYARLKLGEYIADCDKVLYLDTDVLVRDGLKPLWDTDLGGNWVGACIDLFVERQEGYKQKIGMADGEYYFNAGVLLINLKKWRRHDIFKMSCEWVEQYKDVMQYQDQDILNGLFKGGVCYANSRFNFMPTNYAFMANGFASRHTDPLYLDRTNTAMPVAVSHYCGSAKPWHRDCTVWGAERFTELAGSLTTVPEEWRGKLAVPPTKHMLQRWRKKLSARFLRKIY